MNQIVDLSGQVAFVTGGGRGIGREIAEQLAKAGATVAIAARTVKQLEETVATINTNGGHCLAFELDITDAGKVKQTVADIIEQLGTIDLLINNAGIGAVGGLSWQVNLDDWWRVMEVNVRGAFNCAHAVLNEMIERNQGRIINIGSYAAVNPTPMASAYGASKAALLHFSNTIGEEIRETNVSIFTISPGLVYTEMTKDVPVFQNLPDSAWIPVARAGEVCLLLASGAADKLSGRFMHVSDDDIEALLAHADEIVEQDLQVLRLRRLAEQDT